MPTPARLRSSRDIRGVFDARTSGGAPTVVVHARRRDAGPPRVAVVASRRVGGAVQRNRAKRRLRAALRSVQLPGGHDLVVSARRAVLDAPFQAIVDHVDRAVAEAARSGGVSR